MPELSRQRAIRVTRKKRIKIKPRKSRIRETMPTLTQMRVKKR